MAPTWIPDTEKAGESIYSLRGRICQALDAARRQRAPESVVLPLKTALMLAGGTVARADESTRPDVMDFVQDALERFDAWHRYQLRQGRH